MKPAGRDLVIAVDGPAASGKGTLAKRLAAHYGLPCLDTGLLYRIVARAMLDAGHDIHDAEAAEQIVGSFDEAGFPEERLRGREIGEAASVVAAMPAVRAGLLARQRRFASQPGGAVLDGRDIGTVICPDAPAKLFVTATPEVRAARRHKELAGRGDDASFEAILADIRRRDARDSGRSDAPLKAAADAVVLDTSALTVEEVVAAAIDIIERRRAA
ncbi:MAG: (d)CMP kinase [Bosea sp. (in: a-proteobacteria)]|uniref:(d)CMP kinase n=1 Tax=unclassified Bosea (in: a-proteobacteria) TaxID=2653178 RepID=UPI000965D5F2|nr:MULTISPECIES: (d)CMP kinase [unclassified Bosea (in: a-proteobacteria)]MBN9441781.1 (d)CMP kinase [Bosea sp. (in: a-proteobacteria)]MBN9457717.1 (d)CMP kinase [Bosea sp. (in: a-proteobacteria)]OJV10282.1 MAG: cytidylate kinase [Bosea sp. 67-29]